MTKIIVNNITSKINSKLGLSGAAFGLGLIDLMKKGNELFIVSADMAKPPGLSRFMSMYPDNFYNVGIAEQNMLGIAAGISSEGYKSIVVAQACFVSMRSFEMMRQYMGYMGSKIIACGIASGFALTYFGNTHYSFEDLALTRTIPGLTIYSPSDASQAIACFKEAINDEGPVYIRFTGQLNSPIIYKDDFDFIKGKSIQLLKGNQISIFATGSIVYNTLRAAEILMQEGISVSLYDVHTIKPIDKEAIIESKDSDLFVSVEEHSVIGGLGSAISDYISQNDDFPKLLKIGVNDRFSKPGDYNYLLEQNGLSPEKISQQILSALS